MTENLARREPRQSCPALLSDWERMARGSVGPSYTAAAPAGACHPPPIVPSNPSSTLIAPESAASVDPELLSLPPPPRRERTAAVVADGAHGGRRGLDGDLRFSPRPATRSLPGRPLEVGDLTSLHPGDGSR